MIRINDIIEGLDGLVGWRQSYYGDTLIDESLTRTDSGLYFQAAHPLLTLENVRAVMPDMTGRFRKWTAAATYSKGDIVSHGRTCWVSLTDGNLNHEPPASDWLGDYSQDFGGYWKAYNVLSAYLRDRTADGIAAMVQRFLTEKQLQRETRSLVERRTFFDGAGRINNTVQNTGRLVGFEIQPVRSMGITTRIEKIGMQFRGSGSVKLYLFHSSLYSPVATKSISYNRNGGYMWTAVTDFVMPYIGTNNSGGSWYLCYHQGELPEGMEAVNVSKDWSREPCGTCNVGSLEAWRELTKYLMVSPFCYGGAFDGHMWDVSTNAYTNTNCYGLNCEVTVACDLTDFIVSQRNVFQNVLQKQVACDMLREIAMNPNARVSRLQTNVDRQAALYELDGNTEGRAGGLRHELDKAYKALDFDTDGLDRVCLACNNGGVRYRVV